jgi:hypothetical protein
MNNIELMNLQKIEDYPLVSILMPANKKNTDGQQTKIRLKNLIQKANKRLHEEFNGHVKELQDKLENVVNEINYEGKVDSFAIFIGKDHKFIYDLPFPVEERVIVDTTFATRDLVFALNRSRQYYILLLSDKICRLFEGSRNNFIEVKQNGFPIKNKVLEEYNNGMEHINEKLMPNLEIRKNFFRETDANLRKIDSVALKPFVLIGVDRNISLYKEVSKYNGKILAEVNGNYERMTIPEISKKVWPEAKKYFAQERANVLKELEEAEGRQGMAFGAEQCWKMAKEGRGKTLLVEINYSYSANPDALGYELTKATNHKGSGVIDDAVDELIELVISKGGDVIFYENGALEKYNHIALIARY